MSVFQFSGIVYSYLNSQSLPARWMCCNVGAWKTVTLISWRALFLKSSHFKARRLENAFLGRMRSFVPVILIFYRLQLNTSLQVLADILRIKWGKNAESVRSSSCESSRKIFFCGRRNEVTSRLSWKFAQASLSKFMQSTRLFPEYLTSILYLEKLQLVGERGWQSSQVTVCDYEPFQVRKSP